MGLVIILYVVLSAMFTWNNKVKTIFECVRSDLLRGTTACTHAPILVCRFFKTFANINEF